MRFHKSFWKYAIVHRINVIKIVFVKFFCTTHEVILVVLITTNTQSLVFYILTPLLQNMQDIENNVENTQGINMFPSRVTRFKI